MPDLPHVQQFKQCCSSRGACAAPLHLSHQLCSCCLRFLNAVGELAVKNVAALRLLSFRSCLSLTHLLTGSGMYLSGSKSKGLDFVLKDRCTGPGSGNGRNAHGRMAFRIKCVRVSLACFLLAVTVSVMLFNSANHLISI